MAGSRRMHFRKLFFMGCSRIDPKTPAVLFPVLDAAAKGTSQMAAAGASSEGAGPWSIPLGWQDLHPAVPAEDMQPASYLLGFTTGHGPGFLNNLQDLLVRAVFVFLYLMQGYLRQPAKGKM